MYIVQMADLHIGSDIRTNPMESEFFFKAAELIKDKIPFGETVLICFCGDIIDSKGLKEGENSVEVVRARYGEAAGLINDFKNNIVNRYNVITKCCPGNHDATHMNELFEFILKVDKDDDTQKPSKMELKTCYTLEISGLKTIIIFVNSCYKDQYKKGHIDYTTLESKLYHAKMNNKKAIIVLHHTIMSMFDEDDSSIRNAAKLVNLIVRYEVIAVLHGHIHGREILSLGQNQCKIIGTGALLSRDNANVNSQFNIIELKNNIFLKILNCRYQADGGNAPWDIKEFNDLETSNIFTGGTFSKEYQKLMDTLDVVTPIYNMRMEIKTTYEEFVADLKEFLNEDKLKIGDKAWTYYELAKMWQANEVPDELYFNHGSYFRTGEMSGIDYVARALKEKPTSNRIVLPTYNVENLMDSLDDKEYLPSLASIQFGKDEDEEKLIVHMYLRALEAKHFFKINICEIEYLLNCLKEKAIKFKEVEIVISAFRVQKKEKFHCFLKSEIDVLASTRLSAIVSCKNFSKLRYLFKEKKDGQETVIKTHGIQTVYQAMQDFNMESKVMGEEEVYSKEILSLLKEVLGIYEKLDRIHKTGSVQSKQGNTYEEKIDNLLGQIIESIEKLEKEKGS